MNTKDDDTQNANVLSFADPDLFLCLKLIYSFSPVQPGV